MTDRHEDAVSSTVLQGADLLLVEDHRMVATALRDALLHHGAADVAMVGGLSEARALIHRSVQEVTSPRPDAAVVDVNLPDGTGDELVADLHEHWPEVPVLLMSAAGDVNVVARAVDLGAAGFVHKTDGLDVLVGALRRALDGEAVFHPDDLLAIARRGREAPLGGDLTEREIEVLQAITDGGSVEAIASELHLSAHTVRNHTRNVMAKLEVHTKLEAVVAGLRLGLVRLPDGP